VAAFVRTALVLGALCFAVAVPTACGTPRVRTAHDFDSTTDVRRYATYAWASEAPLIAAQPRGAAWLSPLDDRRIRRAVDRELGIRGWQRIDDVASADLIVVYTALDADVIKQELLPGSHTIFLTGRGPGTGEVRTAARLRPRVEGTFSIQLYERVSRRVIWIGWGRRVLPDSMDRDELFERIVHAILDPLPGRS
jgi:hypothetical protein